MSRNKIVSHRLALFLVLLLPLTVLALSVLPGVSSFSPEHPAVDLSAGGNLPEGMKAVIFYSIEDGIRRCRVVKAEALQSQVPFGVTGYLCGVVVLGDGYVDVRLDGKKMSPIRKNADGTLSLKHYGKIRPEELISDPLEIQAVQALLSGDASDRDPKGSILGCYSYFPMVAGDSVSSGDRFDIVFKGSGKTFTLPVRQRGYRTFCTLPREGGGQMCFRYLGSGVDEFGGKTPALEARIAAVSEGIRYAEAAVGMDLIRTITIIDLKDRYNAVTFGTGREIWFYAPSFQNESIDELKTIAAHETLHQYVEVAGLARSSKIRELFADLKGYEPFSMERFRLMVSGMAAPTGKEEENLFFPFINEKNFLRGMKGGHSGSGLDEFCVSLIHSLIFIESLDKNLEKPVEGCGEGGRRLLSPMEREGVLENYDAAVDLLIQALAGKRTGRSKPTEASRIFLEKALDEIRQLRESPEPVLAER